MARPGPRLLVERGNAQKAPILAAAANELDRHRQTVAVQATRQSDRRMPRQVEGMCIGIPSLAHGIDLAALDLDRFEQALLDGNGGARQSRHDNGVKARKPGLDLAVEPCS